MKKTVGLIGFGNFGRFIFNHLSRHYSVLAYDKKTRRASLDRVLACPRIILAIPVQNIGPFLKKNARKIKPETVIIDVASVKMLSIWTIRRFLPDNPLLATHPLFGPESAKDGIKGMSLVVCPVNLDPARKKKAVSFLKNRLGLQVITMTPERHDKEMAWVQGLSHFIARSLDNLKMPELHYTTRSFDKLMEMRDILVRTTPDLFLTIEKGNPFARHVRRQFLRQLEAVEKKLGANAGKGGT
jgi:prephenate dehydrogenase